MNSNSDNVVYSSDEALQSFLIIIKESNEDATETAQKMALWLEKHHKKVTLISALGHEEELRELAKTSDIALVLGGDGTILGVARQLYGLSIPLLGVNFGRVGFLADIAPHRWEDDFTRLLNGHYQIQNYASLTWAHYRENACLQKGYAINDVVVARGQIAKAIKISLLIDNVFVSTLHCDGLICSAPLGATAYASAAHGPVAFPALDAHILTPISPYAGAFPPLVLPPEALVTIQAHKGNDLGFTVDGQDYYPMMPDDEIRVITAEHKITMYVRDKNWFWKRLRERGFIMPGPGKYSC